MCTCHSNKPKVPKIEGFELLAREAEGYWSTKSKWVTPERSGRLIRRLGIGFLK
jgi:hypothetical protein